MHIRSTCPTPVKKVCSHHILRSLRKPTLSVQATYTIMHRSTALTFTAALLLGTATAQNITNDTRSNSTITCSEGLKIFVSRGTGESPGVGATGNVTDLILSQINGSNVHPIEYPASFDDPIYFISVANGTQLLKQAVTDYAEACPDSKMALFGYSQVCTFLCNLATCSSSILSGRPNHQQHIVRTARRVGSL